MKPAVFASGNRPPAIFAKPLLLAFATGLGLLSALLGDGAWDALSWLALAAPVGTVAYYMAKR